MRAGTVCGPAGVVASPAAAWLGMEPDRAGRIKVGRIVRPRLPTSSQSATRRYRCLDGQLLPDWLPRRSGGRLRRLGAASAAAEPQSAASVPLSAPGQFGHIGRKSAVADFGRFKLTGAVAWWLWGAVHIPVPCRLAHRLSVMLGWVWSYFTFDVGVRLITEEGTRRFSPSPTGRH